MAEDGHRLVGLFEIPDVAIREIEFDRLDRVPQMLDARRAVDRRGHAILVEQPREADLAHAGVVLGSQQRRRDDHAEKIDEAAAHLHEGFDDDHPFDDLNIARSRDSVPEMWVLGPSPSSAAIASEFGLKYCFAAFIRPGPAVQAFETYRDRFEPSAYGAGPAEPTGALAANVTCAETDAEAARRRATAEASCRRLRRGELDTPPIRSAEAAIEELGGVPDPTPTPIEPGEWPRGISGSPSTVRELFDEMTSQVSVKEVVIQNQIADPENVLQSHELLAEAFDLAPR